MKQTTHADNVRENYRRQGEQRIIQLLLDKIKNNPGLTTDYLHYLLESLKR
jgi:hypothetical protein